jgi:hypothetical protein
LKSRRRRVCFKSKFTKKKYSFHQQDNLAILRRVII